MAKCWEQRGCDEEMQAVCPHPIEIGDNCPTKCSFAGCARFQYELVTDPALVFDPNVDRSATVKDTCTFCGFFLRNAPRIEEG